MKKWVSGLIFITAVITAFFLLQKSNEKDLTLLEKERLLYLTPGGLYTHADIHANGRTIRSEKFADFVKTQRGYAKAGDVVCPITSELADPNLSWVVNGKTYQFCCPYCIDRFLALAKEQPEKILDPDQYVKR